MMASRNRRLYAVVLLWLAVAAARADTLRSPWDGLHVVPTDAPYDCPAPPPFSKSLNVQGYYSDANHSIVDPAKQAPERAATEAPTHLGQWSSEAADAYLTQGSRAAAQCVYSLLDAAAQVKRLCCKVQAWTEGVQDAALP
jgi:poly(beta-D-mannuronate) lyase